MTCCFIGHRDADPAVFAHLIFAIDDMIVNNNVKMFYMGTNGKFDRMAYNIVRVLQREKEEYRDIKYNAVLAYLPTKNDSPVYENTIYPEELETVPKRFAIVKRNKWMIDNSDYVICYVTNTFSNAHKFVQYAQKKGKKIVYIKKSETK